VPWFFARVGEGQVLARAADSRPLVRLDDQIRRQVVAHDRDAGAPAAPDAVAGVRDERHGDQLVVLDQRVVDRHDGIVAVAAPAANDTVPGSGW
jgi:hypothetical protein